VTLAAAVAVGARELRATFDTPPSRPLVLHALSAPAVVPRIVHVEVEGSAATVFLDAEFTPDARYELTDGGGTATFTGFRPGRPANRRFDLWQMLPRHNRRDDQTGDLERFVTCLQDVTDLLLADLDRWADVFDLERAPEQFVDAILADLGNPFPFELDLLGKRRLASVLVDMYRQKGTAKAIRNAVRFFLGIDVTHIGLWAGESLSLGDAELGVDWRLGPSAQFAMYAFNVEVGRALSDEERSRIRVLVDYLKPAHTHFIDLVEPEVPMVIDDWLLGVSALRVETRLA
jgi:phage tail-like protein